MRTARVRMTGVMADAQRTRPQTAGTIRAGIKVLTRDAASKPELVAIYNEGVAAGATFDQITLALKKVKGCPDYPLTPSNAPYFRVNQSDFAYPGAAQYILDTYGEDRGEGQHLYSFPVILASDDVDEVFAETFEAWKASDLQFWSEADASGVLQCMQRQKVAPDRSRRRQWGGRPVEVVKPCEPNSCDVFNSGNCKHSATLYFWVPGVRGAGLIELPFTSLYASAGIVEILEKVTAGLGRIRGMFDGKPIFRVSKRLKSVARFDWQTGKATRSDHWIIHLDADLDMCQILGGGNVPALPCPPVSIAHFEPEPQAAHEPAPEPQAAHEPAPEPQAAHEPAPEPQAAPTLEPKPQAAPEPQTAPEPTPAAHDTAATVKALRASLQSLMAQFNPPWAPRDLGVWMRTEGFSREDAANEEGLKAIADRLAAKLASINSDVPF